MYANHEHRSALAKSGPLIAVVVVHAVVLYAISVSMGMIEVPKFAEPVQAIFIPEAQEAQPEVPVVKPEIADVMPTEEPPPMIDFEEPVVPPAENPMPASNSAINATEAIGTTAQELKTSTRIEPAYPAISRRLSEEGTVRLRVLVDETGRPKDVNVGQSSGFARLDQAAIDAVRRWKFVPATDGQKPIKTWTQVAITFRLTK